MTFLQGTAGQFLNDFSTQMVAFTEALCNLQFGDQTTVSNTMINFGQKDRTVNTHSNLSPQPKDRRPDDIRPEIEVG
ncbi:hypothetical protein ACL6C3_07615 [Capilliphycus salinus ALCB114379]|uniref:hypothetical protein n=1 Tax=Capilliphycus salinus TaxID=2768948 RepID=UPI0039A6CE9C